jgi:hypothetical protein
MPASHVSSWCCNENGGDGHMHHRLAASFREQDEQAIMTFQPYLPLRIPTANDIQLKGASAQKEPPS